MIQEYDERDGSCKKILEKIAKAVDEFKKKLQKEKSYINLINVHSAEKLQISSSYDISEKDKLAASNTMLSDISKIEEKYNGLSQLINLKLNLINEENMNNSFYVREEINTYAELTLDSANFSKKLSRYNMIMNNIQQDERANINHEVCSLEEFQQMSKAIAYKVKNGSDFSVKLDDMQKGDFLQSLQLNEIEDKQDNLEIMHPGNSDDSEERKEKIKKILNNKKYFCLLKEKNMLNLINSLRNIAKHNDVNRVFIRDLGHTVDMSYDIDYTGTRRRVLSTNPGKENYIKVYQFVTLTLTTMLDKFPLDNLDSFLKRFFRQYFYKVEDKTIKIYGRLYLHYELKTFVRTDKFRDDFFLSSNIMQIHRWYQDIIANNNLNNTDYVTNADELMMKYLINWSKEFVILRDVYAMMIVDHYKKKNPFATVDELDG